MTFGLFPSDVLKLTWGEVLFNQVIWMDEIEHKRDKEWAENAVQEYLRKNGEH